MHMLPVQHANGKGSRLTHSSQAGRMHPCLDRARDADIDRTRDVCRLACHAEGARQAASLFAKLGASWVLLVPQEERASGWTASHQHLALEDGNIRAVAVMRAADATLEAAAVRIAVAPRAALAMHAGACRTRRRRGPR